MKVRGIVGLKEKLSITVKHLSKDCKSLEDLSKRLSNNGLQPYYRNGKLTGLWQENRKYRLSTLGVGKEHLKQLTLKQQRLNNLNSQSKTHNKSQDLEL